MLPQGHAIPESTPDHLDRWSVTFLDLAANVPKLSTNATALGNNSYSSEEEEYSLKTVDGGVGVIFQGVETVQEASALCCVGGNFSLDFDGTFALDVDLDSDADTASAAHLAEGLGDVINEGMIWENNYHEKNISRLPLKFETYIRNMVYIERCRLERRKVSCGTSKADNLFIHYHIVHFLLLVALPTFHHSDDWGSITLDHKELLDGGRIWSVKFDDYSLVAGAGGAPLLVVSRDAVTRGGASVKRIANAASPAVHRVLVAAFSTLASTGMFELSLEGVVTRAISVDASAETLQNVSFYCVREGSVQVTLVPIALLSNQFDRQ